MALTLVQSPARNSDELISCNFIAAGNPVVFKFNSSEVYPLAKIGCSFQVCRTNGDPISKVIRMQQSPVNGDVLLNVTPYLQPYLSLIKDIEYDSLALGDNTSAFGFIVKYGFGLGLTDETGVFYVGDSVKQILEKNGQNLSDYTILVDDSVSPEINSISKFLTEFDSPRYWIGYPWDLQIYNQFTYGTINYDEFGGINIDFDYGAAESNTLLRIRLPSLTPGTKQVDVYIEPGLGIQDAILTEDSDYILTEDSDFIIVD